MRPWKKIGVSVTNVVRCGYNSMMLVCANDEENKMEENKNGLSQDFLVITKMEEVKEPRRYMWLECRGVPMHAWLEVTFKNITRVWGKLVTIERDEKLYEYGGCQDSCTNQVCGKY